MLLPLKASCNEPCSHFGDSGPTIPVRHSGMADLRNGRPPEWGASTRTNWDWKCYRTHYTVQTWPPVTIIFFGPMK